MRYFPFLRGKQNELIAVRDLAADIVRNGNVIPILEPVNSNSTTLKSINQFMKVSMPFLFICNPIYGEFSHNPSLLVDSVINHGLKDYGNWVPSFYINEATTPKAFDAFIKKYDNYDLALIYYGKPRQDIECEATCIRHHVFVGESVGNNYIQSIPRSKRVFIKDPFRRQAKNADYPDDPEFFTDLNTNTGNLDDRDFGDFSIVGDYFIYNGGPAHAVAVHHIHFVDNSHSLHVSHFISDRTETAADIPGKIIEAVNHLVESLDNFQPNNTQACEEYREMSRTQYSHGLGYLKRLAIKHHLEVILGDGGLGVA